MAAYLIAFIWFFLFFGLRNVSPLFRFFFQLSMGMFFLCIVVSLYLYFNDPGLLCAYLGFGSFEYDMYREAYFGRADGACPILH
jgi:hypothetical protein